jgi:glycosyltransferase involved in cell wall biosynthesis
MARRHLAATPAHSLSKGAAPVDDAVIVPVFNEVDFIDPVLETLRESWYGEIIVVDDGSTDGSTEKLAERDDILVVRHAENLGYGKSLIDGIVFARFAGIERAVTMDADGQHVPSEVPKFFAALEGVDFVSGSRYRPESQVISTAPEDRRHINEIITTKVNEVTGYGITDAFCGLKAYNLSIFDRVGLTEPGYAICCEFWARAYRAGLTMKEIPVERIYVDLHRTFGPELDDPDRRLHYYLEHWERALSDGEQ